MENMASCLCCLRCRSWTAGAHTAGHLRLQDVANVKLDTSHIGNDVVIVKNGRRICGTGGALANAPIVQNKAYFEVKLQSSGIWGIGVATRQCSLHVPPLGSDSDSWVLRQDGSLVHNGDTKAQLSQPPQEGDIIALTYDHVELNYFLNGTALNTGFRGIKGTIFPVLYVDEGAILDVHFTGFYHMPPDGFEEIMIEKSLL